MSNFNMEFKKILKNLEENIKDENALEAAKVEMFNLYNLFFDEVTNLEQSMMDRITAIAESQLHVEDTIKTLGKSIKNIEKDIYIDEDMEDEENDEDDDEEEDYEDEEIEVRCPYCNKVFTAEMDELTGKEITCPECDNTIELDWGDECDEDGCDCCGHHCHHEEEDEDEDM